MKKFLFVLIVGLIGSFAFVNGLAFDGKSQISSYTKEKCEELGGKLKETWTDYSYSYDGCRSGTGLEIILPPDPKEAERRQAEDRRIKGCEFLGGEVRYARGDFACVHEIQAESAEECVSHGGDPRYAGIYSSCAGYETPKRVTEIAYYFSTPQVKIVGFIIFALLVRGLIKLIRRLKRK